MSPPWVAVCLVAAIPFLWISEAKPDDADKAAPSVADSMIGKEAGQVRDDNGLQMKMVWCPPGDFTMGDLPAKVPIKQADDLRRANSKNDPAPEPGATRRVIPVQVSLTRGYWIGKCEVTQSEWKRHMETEPWVDQKLTVEGDDVAATYIDWFDALWFCEKLTEQERKAGRLPEAWEYTLPTEAQWERACRAGTETRFSFGDDASKLGEYAWFDGNARDVGEKYAHQVRRKKPNPWGLYDMHGNVWEWCRGYYSEKLPGGPDPEVTVKTSHRVYRGGSCLSDASYCRAAYRRRNPAGDRDVDYGFRVALSSVQPVK